METGSFSGSESDVCEGSLTGGSGCWASEASAPNAHGQSRKRRAFFLHEIDRGFERAPQFRGNRVVRVELRGGAPSPAGMFSLRLRGRRAHVLGPPWPKSKARSLCIELLPFFSHLVTSVRRRRPLNSVLGISFPF